MLRAAGIPARIVVGYQGGEFNPYENYMLVRQYDAHAWAEAWLPGKGWTRFDPTASVAPARIRLGIDEILGQEFDAISPLSMYRFRKVPLVAWLQMRWDMVNYHWARLVLGYDDGKQFELLESILGQVTPMRLVLLLLAAGGLTFLLVGISVWRGRDRVTRDPVTRLFLRFCRRLKQVGLTRQSGEGALAFGARVCETRPDLAVEVNAITNEFSRITYAGEGDVKKLRTLIQRFRP